MKQYLLMGLLSALPISLNAMEAKIELADKGELGNKKIVSLSEKELYGNSEELDKKLLQAAQQGFCYVEIPKKLKDWLDEVVQFANGFYKDEELKAKEFSWTTKYHDFKEAQVESFVCQQPYWKKAYPKNIKEFAQELTELSELIFHKTLSLVLPQLPQNQREKATGGLYNDKGVYFFSFNHYRPTKKMIGFNPHRDIGYVTVLFINKKGLNAKIDGKWESIVPKPGHFIVNFGKAFEVLVNDTSKLVGSLHYVEEISEEIGDRISFGLFSNSSLDASVYKVTSDGNLEIAYDAYVELSKVIIDEIKGEEIDIESVN